MVVKWPRFAFEKFPGADGQLHTSMQSVGEAMAIGRTFKQAFVKAMRSRELDVLPAFDGDDDLLARLESPSDDRYEILFEAIRRGHSEAELCGRTGIDPWFMAEMAALARGEDPRRGSSGASSRSTPAPPSSRPRRPTTTRAGSAGRRTRCAAATARAS